MYEKYHVTYIKYVFILKGLNVVIVSPWILFWKTNLRRGEAQQSAAQRDLRRVECVRVPPSCSPLYGPIVRIVRSRRESSDRCCIYSPSATPPNRSGREATRRVHVPASVRVVELVAASTRELTVRIQTETRTDAERRVDAKESWDRRLC